MSDAAPQPLPESGWQRLWHLISLPSRTPEQHAELQDLHDQAQAHADSWKADPEQAVAHVKTALDNLSAILKGAVAQVPALSGLSTMLNNLDATLLRLHGATTPPPAPPEMPPAVADEPQHVGETLGNAGAATEGTQQSPAEGQDAGDSSSEPASDSGSSDSGASSADDTSANDLNKEEADANAAPPGATGA